MQFSYRWLKELSQTKRTPEKLGELLLTHAFEVESIEPYPHGLEDIVIGKVLKVVKHPDADRLRVTTVETKKGETRTIVCGAPNVAVGQKVAVILPGGTLPDGTVIREAELRGVVSQGMICSLKELGLGDSHAGILVLDKLAPVGKSFAHFVGLDDFLLDVKILPDRSSDALSYLGLAREIAALEGVEAGALLDKKTRFRSKSSSKVPKISVKTDRCGRYMLAHFQKIEITESPLWLKVRLITSGLRPVNSIVDITNYLMLETGQPMHAFDADAIARSGIIVRMGKAHERLTLLDGKTITLTKDDIVIADAKKALALAGVMGGKSSAITEKTKNIVVEIANFDGSTLRKTRKRHHLVTDASFRFERGLDLDRPSEVLPALVNLLARVSSGEYVGSRDLYRVKAKEYKIVCTLERVEKVLGTTMPLFEVVRSLALLGLSVKKIANRKELEVLVSPRRMDLRDEYDLIEEIGRMRGYDKIVAQAPMLPLLPVAPSSSKRFTRSLQATLTGLGFDEVMTYSFYSVEKALTTGLSEEMHLAIENPMNPEQRLMRFSLLPNLLSVAEKNIHQIEHFDLFERGSVFEKGKMAPLERKQVALLSLLKKNETTSFAHLKGKIEALFVRLGVEATFEALVEVPPVFHPTRATAVLVQGKKIGLLGELHPGVAKELGLPPRIAMAEFNEEALAGVSRESVTALPLQRFPYAYRDISLIGPKVLSYAMVRELLFEAGAPLLLEAELFDVYEEGEEKSYAFHLAFGLPERTIKSSEMDAIFDTIVKVAKDKLDLRLRLS